MITAMNQNLNTHTNGNLVMLMPAVLDNSVQYMNTQKQPQLQPYQPTMTAVPVPPPLTMGISSTSPTAASCYNAPDMYAPESNFAQRMSSHNAANLSHGPMRLEALFVGDLSYFCTDAHLQQLFEPYGPVHKAVVRKSKTQEPLHYGFVEVPVDKAHLAIQELNGLVFLGRKVRIGVYKTKMEDYHDQLISLHVSFLCRLTNFIVDEVFLAREFSRFGEVQDCVVKQHCSTPVSGSPRQYGYAFVYYADMASAQRALDALQQDSLMNHVKYACNLSHNEHHHQPNQHHNHQQHHNTPHATTTTPHPLQNINHFYHPGVHQPLPPANNTNHGSNTAVNSYSAVSSHHPPSPPLLHIPSPTNANVSQSLSHSHSSHNSPPMTFQPLPNLPLPLPMSIPLAMPISYPYAPQGASSAPDAPHYLYNNKPNSNNNPTNNSNYPSVMNTYVQYPVGHAAPPSSMAPHFMSSASQPAGNSPPLVPLMVPPPLPMHGAASFQNNSAPQNMNHINHMNISYDPHRPVHLSSHPNNSMQFVPPPLTAQFQSYHH